jgi:dihydrofolate reductase
MARTIYYVASSLDGFIADSQDSLDWLFQFNGFEGQEESYKAFIDGVGAIVMGSDTYRFILDAGAADAWEYGPTPTWVFTHRELPGIPGADITFIRGDVAEFYQDICADAGDKDVWVVGGGKLVAQFADQGLLDELILTVVPVCLGSGKQLLPVTTTTAPARLLGSREFGKGVVELRYELPKADSPAQSL